MKELTRRYEEIVEKHDLEEWDPKDLDVKELKKGLVSVQEASFCTGCLNGGGRTDCEMRSCASNKKNKELPQMQ